MTNPMRTPTPDQETDRRWRALYVLCGGMLMIVLDATIVNVALPTIQEDLGFSQSSLAWVVNAYLIAFGGLLLLSGRIGDLLGQRRVFLAGLGVFTLASLACAVSQTQGMLIGARFIQGAGGAVASAVILGMIVTMFPEPREQAKAIGVYGFVASAGASLGLITGGILTDLISWHWIFLINVPIGIATALLAVRLVDDHRGIGLDQGADIPGAVLLTGGLMLGVYTLLGVEQHGWGATQTLGLGAISIVLLAAFLGRQARIENPLMPLRLFRSRNVSGANAIMAFMVVGFFGMFFLGALYLQGILGYSPLEVGLAFLPACLVMGTLSFRYSERLIMGIGPRITLLAGLACSTAAILWFSRTPVEGDYWADVFGTMILFGFGAGLSFPSLISLSMSGVEMRESGLASGLINTTTQVGGAIGLAVLATLAAERSDALEADGESLNAALNSGYHLAYLIGAACMVLAILTAVVVLKPAPPMEGHGAIPEDDSGEAAPAYAEAA